MRLTKLAAPCAAILLALMAGAAADPQAAPQGLAPGIPAPAASPANLADDPIAFTIDLNKFNEWRNSFRQKALAAGISPKTFTAALDSVTPNPSIIAADGRQPETTRAIWDYLDSAVSAKRVANGTQLLTQHTAILTHIQRLYGIAPRFVVAIWGMESNYGSNVGGYNVFEALATLAYQGRRASYAESELLSALKIADRGDATPAEMMGSWAGAMGQTQFMPSAYLAYAVDDDGDGHRDLFASIPDILASTANFLAKWNWRTGESWGEEVKIPKKFDYSAADPTITLPMSRWRQLGIRTLKGARIPGGVREAALFLPAGHKGPAFLLRDNFKTILRYNNSTAYGLAVGLLADRLKGAHPLTTAWPREERPLTAEERREMQDLLNKLGYQVGDADGILGAQTRLAIKSYQKKIGQPADGFATVALLERLRADAAPPAADTSGATPAPPANPPH